MNILSIDFDWIMQPTIEAYNNLCHGNSPLGAKEIWEQIEMAMPGFEARCDLNRFTDLYFTLKEVMKNLTKGDCYVGIEHGELYNFMQVLGAKKYNVYNIDHHHDLGYHIGDEPLDEQSTSLANWAAKAHTDLNMYKYTWIHNVNSCMPEEVSEKLKYTHTTDLRILDGIKFDKVFICASWEWVPPKYQNLFAILTSLVDDK